MPIVCRCCLPSLLEGLLFPSRCTLAHNRPSHSQHSPSLRYELFTAAVPFKGVPRALLGHQITREAKRPIFPLLTPLTFRDLAERCWCQNPEDRRER